MQADDVQEIRYDDRVPTLTVNGREIELGELDPHTTVLELLRTHGLVGSKEGCAEGECGACAVALVRADPSGGSRYVAINSCLTLVGSIAGGELVSVEGVRLDGDTLHPVQAAMVEQGGSQCGYCTPGFVVSMFAEYYRRDRPAWDPEAIAGNLCRCTGYRPIRDAMRSIGAPARGDRFAERLDRPAPTLGSFTQLRRERSRRLSRPCSLAEALELLAAEPEAKLVAGGTDVVVEINQRDARWPSLISLEAVTELRSLALGETMSEDVIEDVVETPSGGLHVRRQTTSPELAKRAAQPTAAAGGMIETPSGGHHVRRQTTNPELAKRAAQPTAAAGGMVETPSGGHHVRRQTTNPELAKRAAQPTAAAGGMIEIGAGLSLSELEHGLAGAVPLLDELFPLFSSRLIRNRATLGGNLVNASPIGDGPPVLLALDAELELMSKAGTRTVALAEFFTGYRKTVLAPGELLTKIRVPRRQPALAHFYKVSKRVLDDISTVAAAFALELDADNTITRARLAYGGIAATPVRARAAEDGLIGRPWTRESVAAVAPLLALAGTPMSDQRGSADYRAAMTVRLLEKFCAETTLGRRVGPQPPAVQLQPPSSWVTP
jgi:xanthine dehydrogenase iron-sulfur cluster and FAD-binding subunit A